MRLTVSLRQMALLSAFLAIPAHASLYGPWIRYDHPALGFQTLCVSDWRVIPVQNGVVFVMQSDPEPKVRMAVGRITAGRHPFNTAIRGLIQHKSPAAAENTRACQVAGLPALTVEGPSKEGYSRDYYVNHGDRWYWISFSAESPELFPQYAESFEMILRDFRFL